MNQYHNTIDGIKSFSFVPSIMSATIKIRWAEDEHILVLESDVAQVLIKKEYARHPTAEEVHDYLNPVDKEAERLAAEKAAADKALADKKAADEKAAADKALADKKAADEKAAADKAAADKADAEQKAAADKAAADKTK